MIRTPAVGAVMLANVVAEYAADIAPMPVLQDHSHGILHLSYCADVELSVVQVILWPNVLTVDLDITPSSRNRKIRLANMGDFESRIYHY